MTLTSFIYRHINTLERVRYMMIVLNVLSIAIVVTLYAVASRRDGAPFSYTTLGRDFLLNVPALLYIFFLGARFLQSRHTASNKEACLTLIVLPYLTIFIIFVPLISNPVFNSYAGESGGLRRLLVIALLSNMMLMLVFSLSYLYTRAIRMRLNLLWAEREKARFQFHLLKNQMNPHFLFNALNVAAALPYEDAERASLFIKQLGTVYRYMLRTSDKAKVTLGTEMEFVSSYLYLQNVRFEGKLLVSTSVSEDLLKRMVIPGSVQLLIENALKHNTASEEAPLRISIMATEEGVEVSNNMQLRDTEAQTGLGLQNLRQQYRHLGKDFEIRSDKNQFSVYLPYI